MPAINTSFADFLAATPDLKFTSPDTLHNEARLRTYFLDKMLRGRGKDKVFKGGTKIKEQILAATNNNASFYSPNDVFSPSQGDTLKTVEVGWAFFKTDYSYTEETTTLNAGDPEYDSSPFFKAATMNGAVIIKHRLRADEQYIFDRSRRITTKVIIPFERTDLSLGGRSLFVGQRGWQDLLNQLRGTQDAESRDVWSATPGPVQRGPGGRFVIRHGAGVSTFAYAAHGVVHELAVFVAREDPVKLSLLTLTNRSARRRRLEVVAYNEWCLGPPRAGEQIVL